MTIDGYADRLSYAVGDLVSLCCSTTAERFSVEVARVGGSREIVWRDGDVAGVSQPAPKNAAQLGCGWTPTVQFTIPESWRSGYYEVILRTRDSATGRDDESLAFFAVRHSEQPHDRGQMLLVLATNTYNAYNDWGGPSLYTGATRVSFGRPMARGFLRKPEPYLRYPNLDDVHDPEHERFRTWADQHGLARWSGSSGWYQWERLFVQWAERAGYTVDVAVNADLEDHPEIVDDYPLLVSVGHDEYWSWGMRDTAEAFIERGGNYAFLSGNSVCWQVRYEDDGRTMVCFKGDVESDPLYATDQQHLVSTLWCSQLVNRPENQLTGVSFSRGGYIRMGQAVPRASGGLTAWRPGHWIFDGCDLHYGDLFGSKDSIAVYEVDGCEFTLSADDGLPVPTGQDGTPPGFTIVATAPARLWTHDELPSRYRASQVGEVELFAKSVFGEAAPESIERLAHNHAVMGVYNRGGTVFTSGVTDWVYGLAGHDSVVSQVTRNVLNRLTT